MKKKTSNKINEFKRKFSFYLTANDLDKKNDATKVAHLKLALPLNDLIDSFLIQNITVKKIFVKLSEELLPKSNISYEWYKFFGRKQEAHENFNEFYVDLINIGNKCEFGDQLDSNIKAIIIYGLNCKLLQEQLLHNPDMSLKEVVNYCRASEDAKINSQEISKEGYRNSKEENEMRVNMVKKAKAFSFKGKPSNSRVPKYQNP